MSLFPPRESISPGFNPFIALTEAVYGTVVQPTRWIAFEDDLSSDQRRANTARRRYEGQRSRAQHREAIAQLHRDLATIEDPLAVEVLLLHAPDRHGDCDGCNFTGYEAEAPEWPCHTTELIARFYGIETP